MLEDILVHVTWDNVVIILYNCILIHFYWYWIHLFVLVYLTNDETDQNFCDHFKKGSGVKFFWNCLLLKFWLCCCLVTTVIHKFALRSSFVRQFVFVTMGEVRCILPFLLLMLYCIEALCRVLVKLRLSTRLMAVHRMYVACYQSERCIRLSSYPV